MREGRSRVGCRAREREIGESFEFSGRENLIGESARVAFRERVVQELVCSDRCNQAVLWVGVGERGDRISKVVSNLRFAAENNKNFTHATRRVLLLKLELAWGPTHN